jgi:hypothetical protein
MWSRIQISSRNRDNPKIGQQQTILRQWSDSAEEARLTARVWAFEETPEGLARRRIMELRKNSNRSSAEQSELDGLRTPYPDPLLDSDDPLDFTAAYRRKQRRSGPG